MYVELKDNNEYKKSLVDSANKIENLLNSEFTAFNKQFITNKTLTSYRNTLGDLGLSRVIENIILEYANKSELRGAFSSDLFFLVLTNLIKQSNLHSIKTLNEDLSKIKKILDSVEKQYISDAVNELINSALDDKLISSMVIEAINLAGVDGKITPIKSPKDDYSIELISGYTFNVSPYSEFLNNDNWNRTNVKVLVIDGIIEKESEISNLLQEISIHRSPTIIVARGFGEEVLSTLSSNYIRGSLDVIPIKIPFELDCINLIADIAICCGSDTVTPFKGDIVSLKRFNELQTVDSVEITKKSVSIKNKKNKKSVDLHLNDLVKRRNNETEGDLIDLLNQRINSLSSRTVYIKLGKGTDKEKLSQLENIDYGIRLHKSCFDYGMIDFYNFLNLCQDISDEFKNILKKTKVKIMPILSIYSALFYAIDAFKLLSSVQLALLCQQQ